jgi:hypothetical protein
MCASDPKIKIGEESDKVMKAFVANYPQMANVIGQQMVPLSLSELEATKAVHPQLQQLGIQTDLNTLNGPGGQLLDKALEMERKANPEYYGTRASTANALEDLYKSIDLSGGLSGGERAEIERANNRSNIGDGLKMSTPTSAIENAMQFGQAANAKKLQQQGILTGAVATGTGFLPASKSNIDPFQIATGRSSQPTTPGGAGMSASLGAGMNNSISGMAGNAMDANVSRRSSFEKFMGSMPDYS